MRVLIIKTSSMGDIIHTLPALSDAAYANNDIVFDWVIEEPFKEIPRWHKHVDKVIPVSLRRWRKNIFSLETRNGLKALRNELKKQQYDFVLDAQGLIKSAFLTYFVKAKRVGLDFKSARESFASFAYQKKHTVNFYQHAVVRMRALFSKALGYSLPQTLPNFGINRDQFKNNAIIQEKYFVFLHGTTWESKLWPVEYWMQLAKIISANGYRIKIGGGNAVEVARAKEIAKTCENVDVFPLLTIAEMASVLANAKGAVAVDTGLGHLAAALNIPTVSIYGSTDPNFTGALGDASLHLAAEFSCAPCLKRRCEFNGASPVTPTCYATITPELVWKRLESLVL